MINLQRINTSHEHYPFVEELMQTAFPIQERRNADLQREYTDNKPHFHTLVILYKNLPIGLLTIWDLESFHYIEHFAIHEKFRNKGYGHCFTDFFNHPWKYGWNDCRCPADQHSTSGCIWSCRKHKRKYRCNGFKVEAFPRLGNFVLKSK